MRKIGRYRELGILGRGGMSTVYKVAMPYTGKIVALKLMAPPELLVDLLGLAELKALFLGEATTMAQLNHPHIADVWDVDEHRGMPFFIMEYFCNNLGTMIGEDDKAEKPTRPLSLDRIFRYGGEILDGLCCLHQAGIVHRDIKPFNILITNLDTVKIADFGLSKLHGEEISGPPQIKVGSPFYAAPEQQENPNAVDGRADLFSCGIMLYRLLHGVLPGQGRKVVNPDLEQLTSLWDSFLDRAMAHAPADRFQSAKEMRTAFERLRDEWHSQKEHFCRIFAPTYDEPARPATAVRLRHEPLKVPLNRARKLFEIDPLMQPKAYLVNDFTENGDGTVTDRYTNLLWQAAGSDYPLPWQKAGHYIEGLNLERFAGRNNWRLPTVNELLSLVAPVGEAENICTEEVFDRSRRWLWSCDCRSAVASWYVSMDMGFVAWQEHSCCYYVRAVSSLESKPGTKAQRSKGTK